MIIVKSPREIQIMREAGQVAAEVREALKKAVRPGVTTLELNALAEGLIRKRGGVPTFKGYHGFPASICTSVNEEVVHGIPGHRRLQPGDIISIDIGVTYKGYIGDTAVTVGAGDISPDAQRLLTVTEESLLKAVAQCLAGNHLGDVSHAVQQHAEAAGLGVVRDYVGHGIGQSMHEDPQIPNYGQPGTGPLLQVGMVLAIEPMLNLGTWEVRSTGDGWTVVTADASLSAHFEHTVAVTDHGPEILTRL